MDSRLRRFPPDRVSAVPYGQTVDNAMRCPPLAHRSAAAHKLHSAQANRYKIRESQNQNPGTGLSLFQPGGCPNDRDHRNAASDGRIEIDNNTAERALRTVALGRKNFPFAGSDAGGDRAAAIYSLIGSAKLNGLDPEAYLRFVIARIADYRINELDDLLPWRVAEQIANTEHHAAAA